MSGVTVGPSARSSPRRSAASVPRATCRRKPSPPPWPLRAEACRAPRTPILSGAYGRYDVDDLHAVAQALGTTTAALLDRCTHCGDEPKPWTACLACGTEGAR